MKEQLTVELIGDPQVLMRCVLPCDTLLIAKDKYKYPFLAQQSALIKIHYVDENGKEINKIISNPTNHKYDGATIPFRIGKGNPKLLVGALFHDLMCDDKSIIDFNRRLSSLILKDLLIQCKVNILIAWIMFFFVEIYQKRMDGWK